MAGYWNVKKSAQIWMNLQISYDFKIAGKNRG
jgi:plasmid maintenance system antidote protein VapI